MSKPKTAIDTAIFAGFAALVAATVGCGGGAGDGTGPGVDAGGDADAGDPGAGLRINIEADPGRGEFEGDFDPSLDEITVDLSDFRAIGDAAPGDERTRVASLTWRFLETDNELVRFDNAPIGVYSRIRARVDRFTASGDCEINGTPLTWEIDVEPPGGVEIDLSIAPVNLDPSSEAVIQLEARLDHPFDEVDWEGLTPVGGVVRVDDSSSEADDVYEKLGELLSDN